MVESKKWLEIYLLTAAKLIPATINPNLIDTESIKCFVLGSQDAQFAKVNTKDINISTPNA